MADKDVRFSVPLYTQAETARYLDMPATTLRSWTKGYARKPHGARPAVRGHPLVTYLPADRPSAPTVPFIGLAEGMFLSALRKAGVPLQQIRPALKLVQQRLGIAHALASKRLYVLGAQLLWEVAEEGELTPGDRRSLIVLRDGQYVFREVVDGFLRRIDYADDGYAARVALPGYEVAQITASPAINFGYPYFEATGTPVEAVLSRLRAGEPLTEVADDFDLNLDEVSEAADRAGLVAA
ncbi:DUF433 domain-containing protein [Actinoplanes sp. NPDC051859]|uniref:DUF433 domain-containing protein n=1 Tax=Actinoplanes sp. NPDC051859 TaxID=3363909 RepID=UPI0037B925B7